MSDTPSPSGGLIRRNLTRQSLTRRTLLAGAAAVSTFSIVRSRSLGARSVLRVGDMNSIAFQGVLEVSGLDKDLDYDVEYSKFPAGAPEIEAINAGAIDFGKVGDTPFLFGYAAGSPVRAVGAIQYRPTQIEFLVRKDVEAKSIHDLKGRKIAVNRGGGGHLFALSILNRNGLTPNDVELVFLGPVDAKPAFASGAVDAWIAWPAYSTLAKAQDGARPLYNLTDVKGDYEATDYHIAHTDAIAAKRDLILDYQKRIYQARIWSLTHVDEVAAVISRDTKLPLDLAKQIRIEIEPRPIRIDDQVISALQSSADLFAKYAVIKPLKVEGAFDTSFQDATLPT